MSEIDTQQDVTIDKEEPFLHCKFNRKDNAKILENVLKYTKSNAVVNLNAPWGYGKTTFLKMFQQQLINNGTICLYFSAWEYDYIEDPFSALIAHIQKELNTNEEIRDKNTLRKMFNNLMPIVANIGLKTVSSGILNLESVKKIIQVDDDTEKDISAHAGKMAQDLLSNYVNASNQIELFKESLESFAKLQSGGYITIIIDELDRCRPSFSIEMLERVKHIMSVPGVKFVLGTDKEQLSQSIKVLYGNHFNSILYLERFIDYEYKLDIPNYKLYIEMLIEEFSILDNRVFKESINGDSFRAILNLMTNYCRFGLRTLRQLFFKLHITLISINKYSDDKILVEYLLYKLVVKRNEGSETFDEIVFLSEIFEKNNELELYVARLIASVKFYEKDMAGLDSLESEQISNILESYAHNNIMDKDKMNRLLLNHENFKLLQ